MCSKLVVFCERLQAICFCTLDEPFSEHPIDLNPALPSTVFPPYGSTRALSNVARSKTSSDNPLLDTQRGDRNQAGGSERELGDESPADMICCRSRTQTAAAIDRVQPQIERENLERKTHLPCMRPLVFLKPTRLAIRFVTARESAMVFSLRVFHKRAIDQDKLGFVIRVSRNLRGLCLRPQVLPRDIALFVV